MGWLMPVWHADDADKKQMPADSFPDNLGENPGQSFFGLPCLCAITCFLIMDLFLS